MIRTTGYTLSRNVVPVNEEEINKHLQALARQYAKWIKVNNVEVGDRVTVSIKFKASDNILQSYEDKFIIGGGRADKAFEEVILMMGVGKTVNTTITTLENPRKLWVEVTLHNIERMIPATINDKLIRKTTNYKTLKEYVEHLWDNARKAAEEKADDAVRGELFQQLAYAYPDTKVDENLVKVLLADNPNPNMIDEFKAAQHVKALEILSQVADQENLNATDFQFRQYAINLVNTHKKSMKYIMSRLDKEKVMKYLSQRNAIEFLVKNNLGK